MFKKLTAVLTLLFCFSVVFFSSPKVFAEGNTATVYDDSFNTENIITFSGQNAVEAANAVQDELQRIDGIFSLTKDSEASRLNRDGNLIDASDDFVYVMNRAKELYLATDGAFNPATYLLTDLWQLSGRFADGNSIQKPYDRELYTLPQQKYIDAFRQLLNFGDIRIEGNDVYLPQNSVTVDGELIPHFLHRRKFEEAECGWYYSQSLKSVLIKTGWSDSDFAIDISFEQFDLIGM